VTREEVVAFEPESHFAYRLCSGLRIRDYRADVTLTPTPAGGTEIAWRSSFLPEVPGTGWTTKLVLGWFVRRVANSLAVAAPARTG
jgi:hypothetical protein